MADPRHRPGLRPGPAQRHQAQPVLGLGQMRLVLQGQSEVAGCPIQLAAAERIHAGRLQRQRPRLQAPGHGRAAQGQRADRSQRQTQEM